MAEIHLTNKIVIKLTMKSDNSSFFPLRTFLGKALHLNHSRERKSEKFPILITFPRACLIRAINL